MTILEIHRKNAIAFLDGVKDEKYRELLKEEIRQLTIEINKVKIGGNHGSHPRTEL